MKATFTIKESKDNQKFQDLLNAKKQLQVGIFNSKQAPESNLSIADIGFIMEYGSNTKNIPARSFLRMPIEFFKDDIAKFLLEKLKSKSVGSSLKSTGMFIVKIINNAFVSSGFGNWQKNAPSTIKSKGFDMPLIHRGNLKNSIDTRLVDK